MNDPFMDAVKMDRMEQSMAEDRNRSLKKRHIYSVNLSRGEYFQVRNNWKGNGKGYRLYIGDDRFVVQIDGEINGKVYPTIRMAEQECERRFGVTPVRVRD